MAKINVHYARYVRQLVKAFNSGGALLVSLDEDGKANPMTIGWGTVGVIWTRKVFTVMVRPSRYTYGCIEATGDFTVCLPYAEQRAALSICGTCSGRDYDKMAECDLTALPSEKIRTPGIEECGVIWECSVMYRSDINTDLMRPELAHSVYAGGDIHRVYYGLVERCIADEDFDERFSAPE
jgi:flavin reductase (DIM6/NTAB) family NADH-FMN oxidoreductase RutF